MTERRDYYEVLGIPRDADGRAIRDAFRQLALKYHPDRNKAADAAERFKEIAEAYAVLHDPRKRAEYDARGHAAVGGFSPEDLMGGIDFEDIFGGLGFDFGGAGLFDRLFRRRAGPPRGANIEVELPISLERVRAGGEEVVRFHRAVTCPSCSGTGAKAGRPPRSCTACNGSGRNVKTQRKGSVSVQQITTCPACMGRGTIIEEPCPECRGEGQTLRDESLTVRIPVGVEEGTALRVPDHGMPPSNPRGRPGDLYVVVRSAPDPRLTRRGADLWRTEKIEVVDAVLGTSIKVPTLDGVVDVKVPAGTQPEAVLRLRGKGLPEFGGARYGDLFLRLQVHIPERLSRKEREAFENLQRLARNRR